MKATCLLLACALVVGAGLLGPTLARADSTAGEKVFKSRCANCHSLTSGLSTIAPDLTDVIGRKAGSLKNYQYSPALRNADYVWTAAKLQEWLASPHNVVPETEMTFPGLKSATERTEVVDFLKQHTSKK
jgi:cytochrome c